MNHYETNLSQLHELAKSAQRAHANGSGTLESAKAAQRTYDLARTAPAREADDARRLATHHHQQAIRSSVSALAVADVWRLAEELACVRRVGGIRYLVPHTSHWAQWQDDDAIQYHGCSSASQLIDRFCCLAEQPWDGTYAGLWT